MESSYGAILLSVLGCKIKKSACISGSKGWIAVEDMVACGLLMSSITDVM